MAKRRGGGGDEERFELGGYRLGREQPGGSVYRYWYDPRTGRGRRKTLKTKAWQEAKQILAAIVTTQPRLDAGGAVPDPHRVLLLAVLNHYLDHRATRIRTGDQAERAFALLNQFLFEVKQLPDTAKADAFGLDLQTEYVRWLAKTFAHSASYIARIMNPIAAAMHFAAEDQAIDDPDGGTRTVRLMSSAPKVHFYADWIAGTATIAAPQKRDWLPTIAELAGFIDCLRAEHAFRFVVLALNTWARPEAILALDLKRQVRNDVLLDLNPPGRLQTKKRRPVIRLTRNLAAWRAEWKVGRPLIWHGETVANVKRAIEVANARWMMTEAGWAPERIDEVLAKGNDRERVKAVREIEEAGGHRITPRVFRSFMATRIRGLKEVRVDREQRQIWLGHLSQDTTANYEIDDPDYLREAAEATDVVIEKIGALTKRSMWPASAQPELPFLRVVKR